MSSYFAKPKANDKLTKAKLREQSIVRLTNKIYTEARFSLTRAESREKAVDWFKQLDKKLRAEKREVSRLAEEYRQKLEKENYKKEISLKHNIS